MTRRIGLVGAPQTGKTELAGVFTLLELNFANLNEVGYGLRKRDSPLRPAYDRLLPPGCISDDGKMQAAYYQYLAYKAPPGTLAQILALEEETIAQAGAQYKAPDARPVVLNWEYLYRQLGTIQLDHLMVLYCNDGVWFNRMRRRAVARGWTGGELSDETLQRWMAAAEYEQDRIIGAARTQLHPEQYSLVDTSAPDWGEAAIAFELERLLG